MLKRRPQERLPERQDPGGPEPEPCSPGSIEQQLDMCEKGSLRGDDILFNHGIMDEEEPDSIPVALDRLLYRMAPDMAEPDREGDEMSGDEHSSGMQGGEPELTRQPHIDSGMPGDRARRTDAFSPDEILGVDLESEKGLENLRLLTKTRP